jgi:transglutaminase-like putative cysteine protease
VNTNVKKPEGPFTRAPKPAAPKLQPDIILPSRWGNWQQWLNVVLLFIALEIAVLSIEQAHWITPQPMLSLILVIAVILTAVLEKIRLWGFLKPIIALIIGLGLTTWQTLNLVESSDATSKFSHLFNIFQSWWQGDGVSIAGDDKIIYAVFIAFVTWIIGYAATWFVLRRHNGWVAVVLGGVMILFNLSNLPDSYYIYFILYFFAALLLIAVTRMTTRSSSARTASYSVNSFFYLGVSLLCITVVAASISWIAPQARATGLQNWVATSMPWQSDILESKINIFNAVPSKQVTNTAGLMKDLAFGEVWNAGDDVKFVVMSERPSYWRMNVYDTYTLKGWTNSTTTEVLLEANKPWGGNESYSRQAPMQYVVFSGIRTDVLFTTGGFISSDIPVWINSGAGHDITAVRSPRILDPGERYTVNAYVSTANESDLSAAGSVYPVPVLMAYLQLPANYSAEIKSLSEYITANSTTPYAKVKAIIGYLAQYNYDLEITLPPQGVDNVEYFLLTSKSGFCLHFASAAVLMLRSQGIPSRLAVGYMPGDPGKTAGQYLVRDKYFHAWAQVYFPDYGWIDVEATPSAPGTNVFTNSAYVSTPTIEESSQWDVWLGEYRPPIQSITNINAENIIGGGAAAETDSMSFGAKLGRALLFVFAAALIIAVIVGIIVATRLLSFRWLWRVDRNTVAYGTYLNMCRLAAMVGITPSPQQTPLEYTAVLVEALPQDAKEINFIAKAYMDNRFGGRDGKPDIAEEAEILKARHVVYNTLIQRLSWLRRALGRR